MKVLFTCGGTAGHINPALGVAGRIKELDPQAEILFVGAENHMETELVPREGYPIRTVRISGFQRSLKPAKIAENIRTVGRLASACRHAREILGAFQPDVAVGTGGYVCYPVLKMASRLGIPTAVHESNAVPGLTTRMLAGSVDRILVGLEESRPFYSRPEKVEVTGTPVRVDFRNTDKIRARRELGLSDNQPLVLAVFGSLGAEVMNRNMLELIARMGQQPFHLIYATGRRYYDQVRQQIQEKRLPLTGVDVREYIYDMPRVMAAADVILCRSGASTISELTYLGKPAVVIPSPNVVNNHQEKNARVLEKAGAAKMMLEGSFTGADLFAAVESLLTDPAALAKMHIASLKMGFNDATDRIAALVLSLADGKTGVQPEPVRKTPKESGLSQAETGGNGIGKT